MRKKKLLGRLVFIILCYGGILPICLLATNDPDCCDDDSCADMCVCTAYANANPCECNSSGSGSGSAGANSVDFSIGFPSFADGDQLRTGTLRFHHEEPSLTMFTLQGLDYLSPAGSYISQTEGDFTANENVTITVTNRRGQGRAYRISDGSDTGVAIDGSVQKVYELKMLDANRGPVVDAAPAYVRLNNKTQGTYILLDYTTGEAVEEGDEYGRVSTFEDVDIIRDEGVIVQIAYPGGLIDLHVIDPDFEYEIRFYAAGDYTYDAITDRYELNSGVDPVADATKRFNVVNPAYDSQDIDESVITRYWDGRTTQWQFQYFANNDLWELRIGEVISDTFTLLRREEAQLVESQDGTERTDVKRVYNADDKLLSEVIKRSERIANAFKLVEEKVDPTGANLITRHGYYSDGANAGKKKYKIDPDGTWQMFDYDSEGRKTLEVESWLDVTLDEDTTPAQMAPLAKATEYSYTPVDTADDGALQLDSPRTETVRILGTVSSVNWNAYYRDADGKYVEISERANAQNATYGDVTNLRSETIYFATVTDGELALRAGRVQQRTREDGTIQEFDYTENLNGDFVVTETMLHVDAPSAVANKSTRQEMTYDALANLVRDEMFVFDGSTYQSLYYLTHTYDTDRNRIESRRHDGIAGGRITYSASYDHGKAVSETDESGRTVSTTYDVLDRKEFEVIEGSAAAGVDDILRHYGYSTAATGCGCTAASVLIQSIDGSLSMTEINETDRVKRKTRSVDVNGLETKYEYTEGGRMTTVTLPSGATRITEKYLDGRVKSITGTGVISQYYTYGVHADGSTWTRVDTATASSPRFRKSIYDLAGRIIKEESPAFDGSTLMDQYAYDSLGRLTSQSHPGQADTLYEYNLIGDLVRSGLDVDANGQLDLASADRITDSTQAYLFDNGSWFEQSTTTVYPELNSTTAVAISSSKRRMSGFTGDIVSERTSVDVYGQSTAQRTEIDRSNKTVVRTTDVPASSIDAVSTTINGYLLSQNSATGAAPTVYTYDALGRRASIKDPRHTQATTLDYYPGTQQVFTQTDGAGNTTAFSYYSNGEFGAGQIASVTDAKQQKSYRAYDLLGRQVQTWGETDYPQAYSYSPYGELETLTTWRDTAIDFSAATWPTEADSASGDVTTWTYQPATGLLTRKEYADGNGTGYTYDAANRLHVRTWARDGGLDTTYSYDPLTGELLSVNYEAADTADITYTYDRLGRQATVTDATGTRSFAYDPATLQLTAEQLDATFYDGHSLSRSYDTLGRSVGYSLKDSAASAISAVSYTYEQSGRLATVSDGFDTFTYGYQSDSNLLASLTAPQHTVDYSYETNRDVMTSVDNKLSGTSYSTYAYTYDELGRRADREQSGTAFAQTNKDTFAYNSRSEVTGSTNNTLTAAEFTPSYTYDQIGNRKTAMGGALSSASVTYTTNELNQYSAISASSAVNPTYDEDGNLETNGTWTYSWNGENRLKSATNGTTTIDFLYDYQGRLVKKDDGTNVEVYVYDGWNRITKFLHSSNFTLHSSYTWGLDLSGSMQGAGGVGVKWTRTLDRLR